MHGVGAWGSVTHQCGPLVTGHILPQPPKLMGLCARAVERKIETSCPTSSVHWDFKGFCTEGVGRKWSLKLNWQPSHLYCTYLIFPFNCLSFLFHSSFPLSPRPQKSVHHYLTLHHGHPCHEISWYKTSMHWRLRSHTELRWHVFHSPQSILQWKKGARLGREERMKENPSSLQHEQSNTSASQLGKWLWQRT